MSTHDCLAGLLSYSGLVMFIAAVLVDALFLLWDVCLYFRGLETISEHCWADPTLVIGLIGWQVVGAIALATHLLTDPYRVGR